MVANGYKEGAWMIMWAALAVLVFGVVTATQAQTREELFDRKNTPTGGVIVDERTGRIDLYDRDSNRVGYGQIDRTTRRVDFFDVRGNRVGSGTLTPSGGSIRRSR